MIFFQEICSTKFQRDIYQSVDDFCWQPDRTSSPQATRGVCVVGFKTRPSQFLLARLRGASMFFVSDAE